MKRTLDELDRAVCCCKNDAKAEPILRAAFAEVRRAAIEEAANHVEDESIRDFPQGSREYQSAQDTLRDAADSVRALLPPAAEEKGVKS